jgi:PAS domain S-box-containing protein
MNLEFIALLINAGLTLTLLLGAYRKPGVPGSKSVLVLLIALIIWSLAHLLNEKQYGLVSDKLLMSVILFSMTIAASAQFTFSLSYTNHSTWINRSTLILLGVMPVITQFIFWLEPWNNALFENQALLKTDIVFSFWAKANTLYVYNLVSVSVLLFINTFVQKPRILFFNSWALFAGAVSPLLIYLFCIIGVLPFPQIDLSLLSFMLAGSGFSYSFFRHNPIEITPVTRDMVVEKMDEGWIVLDTKNNIVDINPAAEKIMGFSRNEIYGKPVNYVLGDLPNLAQILDGNRELQMKRSIKSDDGWRYLNIRVSSLYHQGKNLFGRLIIWRDNTDQKMGQDARQRARDEMFVLLNAISSAASNSLHLNDFLTESIYHIAYPFRSQSFAFFLMEEPSKKGDGPRMSLETHFGFPQNAIEDLASLSASSPLFTGIIESQQSLLIEDVKSDMRVPRPILDIDCECLLTIPLITQTGEEKKILGFMCLTRKEKPIYSLDEIVRLTIISDHIASLIDNDRRRKLAIALSERQRLLRDLHDSVSQKLYGLVTLTEAAQAALDAGSKVDPSQILSKIGENARQAVKEMRLFLFQIQPIDIEEDGLISVLHHRLAAVEGRADIKAKFLADENIELSKDKEIALYFIAQEALNNVLRHANAKSVFVTLKQKNQTVTLEIVDDGIGFDSKKMEVGGLGLQNMKERTNQVDGQIKISSKPGDGTKITISVHKDKTAKPVKIR